MASAVHLQGRRVRSVAAAVTWTARPIPVGMDAACRIWERTGLPDLCMMVGFRTRKVALQIVRRPPILATVMVSAMLALAKPHAVLIVRLLQAMAAVPVVKYLEAAR